MADKDTHGGAHAAISLEDSSGGQPSNPWVAHANAPSRNAAETATATSAARRHCRCACRRIAPGASFMPICA
ncbi:hypothetical protein [Xanthomonas sp. LMG 8992]|uniref:hypothetical protein n=1 Tax=Xanthomonas sp. LMG 8992 TaxID=1591157 RepID=UPI001371778C|nr:hypothetical protein [Xanthomonas sp. LMG 8992]